MELKQLYYFSIAARYGSFSRAAAEAYISQQGLSKAIRSLEQSLGVTLFVRTPGGIRLTPQGVYLQKRCEYLFRCLEDTRREIRQIPPEETAVLSMAIGTPALFSHDMLAGRPESCFPALRSQERSEEQCEEDVLSGVSVAAVSTVPVRPERFQIRPLLRAPLCLFTSPEHPLARREKVRLADLAGETLILLSTIERSNQSLLDRLRAAGAEPGEVRRVPTLLSVFEQCRREGFSIFIRALPERLSASGICCRPLEENLTWDLCFLTRGGEPEEPAAEALYCHLQRELSEEI